MMNCPVDNEEYMGLHGFTRHLPTTMIVENLQIQNMGGVLLNIGKMTEYW